jgi:hypothetical protein
MSMAAVMPRGRLRAGSRVSSAAIAIPSTARKNAVPNGNADHTPFQPNGSQRFVPAVSVSSNNRLVSTCAAVATTNTMRPNSATSAIASSTRSASPTPAE